VGTSREKPRSSKIAFARECPPFIISLMAPIGRRQARERALGVIEPAVGQVDCDARCDPDAEADFCDVPSCAGCHFCFDGVPPGRPLHGRAAALTRPPSPLTCWWCDPPPPPPHPKPRAPSPPPPPFVTLSIGLPPPPFAVAAMPPPSPPAPRVNPGLTLTITLFLGVAALAICLGLRCRHVWMRRREPAHSTDVELEAANDPHSSDAAKVPARASDWPRLPTPARTARDGRARRPPRSGGRAHQRLHEERCQGGADFSTSPQ